MKVEKEKRFEKKEREKMMTTLWAFNYIIVLLKKKIKKREKKLYHCHLANFVKNCHSSDMSSHVFGISVTI